MLARSDGDCVAPAAVAVGSGALTGGNGAVGGSAGSAGRSGRGVPTAGSSRVPVWGVSHAPSALSGRVRPGLAALGAV